jgi:hypothetical protein
MTRNLKALGLVVLAALAAMAVTASAASATAKFHSELPTHTVISGTQVGEDVFTTNAGTVRCKKATYSGLQSGAEAETVEVTPSYSECTAFGFVNATIDVNSCTYKFGITSTTPEPFEGHITICPNGGTITVTAFNCWVHVGQQGPLKGVTYTNEGSGKTRDIRVKVSLSGIHYVQTSKSFPGCEEKTFTNGTYTGEATVQGFSTENVQVGVWVD